MATTAQRDVSIINAALLWYEAFMVGAVRRIMRHGRAA
jgi:hypothetical protein